MGKKLQVIDESYNANPESTESSIKLLSEIDFLKSKRKLLILGDMLELGNFSKDLHTEMASFINYSDIDLVYCLGTEVKNLWENLINEKKGFYSKETQVLANYLINQIKENDLILLKGSSQSGIKDIFDLLKVEKLKRNIA